jgi:hypothetical protein
MQSSIPTRLCASTFLELSILPSACTSTCMYRHSPIHQIIECPAGKSACLAAHNHNRGRGRHVALSTSAEWQLSRTNQPGIRKTRLIVAPFTFATSPSPMCVARDYIFGGAVIVLTECSTLIIIPQTDCAYCTVLVQRTTCLSEADCHPLLRLLWHLSHSWKNFVIRDSIARKRCHPSLVVKHIRITR